MVQVGTSRQTTALPQLQNGREVYKSVPIIVQKTAHRHSDSFITSSFIYISFGFQIAVTPFEIGVLDCGNELGDTIVPQVRWLSPSLRDSEGISDIDWVGCTELLKFCCLILEFLSALYREGN